MPPHHASQTANIRLLVVDDDDVDRKAIRRMLPAGWAVLEARTGQEGLALMEREAPHVALVDFLLPDFDGVSLIEAMARLPRAAETAIVMLTGAGREEVAVEAMKAGAVDYLRKRGLEGEVLRRTLYYAAEAVAHRQAFDAQTRRLEALATSDDVTGLANRRLATRRLAEEVDRARRYGRRLAVVSLQLDGYEQVKEIDGRAAADRLVREVAEAVERGIRAIDLAARIDGASFLLILPETDVAGAREAADRLRLEMEPLFHPCHDGAALRLTLSAGVAELTETHATPEDLQAAADLALYSARSTGGNAVIVVPD